MTKILLVDDTKFLRLATERALDRAGYDVIIATDGQQALELGCDRLLPKINGPEVLKALKKNPQIKSDSRRHSSRDCRKTRGEKSELDLEKDASRCSVPLPRSSRSCGKGYPGMGRSKRPNHGVWKSQRRGNRPVIQRKPYPGLALAFSYPPENNLLLTGNFTQRGGVYLR